MLFDVTIEKSKNKMEYSIEVFDDYAVIKGSISSDVLNFLLKLCEDEGFKYMVPNYQDVGFRLVKEVKK